MVINIAKTKEIVFRRPNPRMSVDVPPLSEAEQLKVKEVNLLGVILSHNLCFNSHVNFILNYLVSGLILWRNFGIKDCAVNS